MKMKKIKIDGMNTQWRVFHFAKSKRRQHNSLLIKCLLLMCVGVCGIVFCRLILLIYLWFTLHLLMAGWQSCLLFLMFFGYGKLNDGSFNNWFWRRVAFKNIRRWTFEELSILLFFSFCFRKMFALLWLYIM
jgi:hypothetical protein